MLADFSIAAECIFLILAKVAVVEVGGGMSGRGRWEKKAVPPEKRTQAAEVSEMKLLKNRFEIQWIKKLRGFD